MKRGAGGAEPAAGIELKRAALFLDLDGTLAEIAPKPGDVSLGHMERTILGRAAEALDGRVAVISGRTIEEVDRILGREVRCVAGVHGLQRRLQDGRLVSTEPHPGLAEARRAFGVIAKAEPLLLLEEKGLSVALHYRQAPWSEPAVTELCRRLTVQTGIVLQRGDMVAELRSPGPDKGSAVTAFMAEVPFRGAVPVFVGDDITDEAGFAAAVELGGFGVLVGAERETLASLRLDDPGAVLRWIETSLTRGMFTAEARA
jgi:trehalose 6-phosphate phosphatase